MGLDTPGRWGNDGSSCLLRPGIVSPALSALDANGVASSHGMHARLHNSRLEIVPRLATISTFSYDVYRSYVGLWRHGFSSPLVLIAVEYFVYVFQAIFFCLTSDMASVSCASDREVELSL